MLGYLQPDGEGGENLDVGQSSQSQMAHVFFLACPDLRHVGFVSDHPLAQGFPLDAGKVKFVVPRVKPRHNYIIARESPLLPVIMMFTGFRSLRRLGKYQSKIYY